MNSFGEGNTSLFDRKIGDLPPGDLRRVPLKEGGEECVPQLFLHRLKLHPYACFDTLHEGPLLLEGMMLARVCGLQVLNIHHSQG